MRSLPLALALIALALPARAEIPTTGADLAAGIEACRALDEDARTASGCQAYQAGAVTGIYAFARMAGLPEPFCLAPNTSDADIDAAILAALAERPDLAAMPAAAVTYAAMSRAYPCADGAAPSPSTTP